MDPVTHLATLRADTERMAAAAEVDLAVPVPSCPEWTMTDLVLHMGRIHRWVDDIIRNRHQERPGRPPAPDEGADLPAWLRDGADRLVEALGNVDPDEPVWNFTQSDTRAAWWHRRQAQETAVHRWDAQRAVGQEQPIDAELAADGIDELLTVLLRAAPAAEGENAAKTMRVETTDHEGAWVVSFGAGGGRPTLVGETTAADATVAGPASDALLFLWNRVPVAALTVTGDPAVAAAWASAVTL